jgi:hypothetical protein
VYVFSTWNVLRLIPSRENKMEEPGVVGKMILKRVLTGIENDVVAQDRNHLLTASTW